MLFSVLNHKSSILLFRPLLRSARARTCGTVDEPPCAPQEVPHEPISTDENAGRCTHKETKYFNPCGQPSTKEAARKPNEPVFNRPECCNSLCPELVPRLDDKYYKTSDKGRRAYRQTWVECPAPVKKTKTSCAFDKLVFPPMEKRANTAPRPKTACNMAKKLCPDTKNHRCTRLVLPGCRSNRSTYHCLYERNPQPYCPTRRCPPYPSFSECTRKRPGPHKPIECKCLAIPPTCEVWSEIEKAVRSGKMKKILK